VNGDADRATVALRPAERIGLEEDDRAVVYYTASWRQA
jgi:hypothetical protein